jgi:nucleoid-associated protein YgaU
MRRGILFGLGLAALLAAAAFLLIPRGGGHTKAPPAMAAVRPAPPAAAPKPPPPAAQAPRFDIVTVAPDGSAVIAGRAAPGALVQVFDGSRKLGEVAADRRGEWVLVPDHPLPAGKRRLTLRAASGRGPIVAATETVAVSVPRAPPPPSAAPAGRTYVVQRGNSLWRIARRFLGSGLRYLAIYSANLGRIRNPALIYPGQVFKLPQS